MDYDSMAKKGNPFEGLSIGEKKRLVVYFCYVAQPVMTMEEIEGKWGSVLPPDEKPTVFDAMQMAEEIRKEIDCSKNKSPSHPGGCLSRVLRFIFSLVVIVLAIIGGITVYLEVANYLENKRRMECNHANATKSIASEVQKPLPKHGQVSELTLPGGEKIEMIYCAPGTFLMGSPVTESGRENDENLHRVTLTKGFWLSKHKVTQAQWISVMGVNSYQKEDLDKPISGVSWHDCKKYFDKINSQMNCGARLPTEAEWEYACRAGTTNSYVKSGYDYDVDYEIANAWGFVNMDAGPMEWCYDWFRNYPNESLENPRVQDTPSYERGYRVLRGGTRWKSVWRSGSQSREDKKSRSRVSARLKANPTRLSLMYAGLPDNSDRYRASAGYYVFDEDTKASRSYLQCYIGFRLCCTNLPTDDK